MHATVNTQQGTNSFKTLFKFIIAWLKLLFTGKKKGVKDARYFAQKLAEGHRLRNLKRGKLMKKVNFTILEFKEKGGRSRYIPKKIKTLPQLAEYLNEIHLHDLLDCDMRINKETAQVYTI